MKVTRKQYGDEWPFTVEEGVIDCPKPSAAVFRHGGKVYALNGIAMSLGYEELEPIWKDNPKIPGYKISIGSMIQLALKQCK